MGEKYLLSSFLQKSLSERPRLVRLAAQGDFLLINPVSAACSDPNHHFALVTAIALQALPGGGVRARVPMPAAAT